MAQFSGNKDKEYNLEKRTAKIVISVFVIFLLLFVADSSDAAELKLTPQFQEISVSQQFQVDLLLDTDEDDINALEGRIFYPKELLELKEIREGNSIVNFWIEKPRIGNGEVAFSGVTPGGYKGKNGLLFQLEFSALKEGRGVIEIRDAAALKNDGKGTAAEMQVFNFPFLISKEIPKTQQSQTKDTEPPESFKPEIARDPHIFDGKWFLVFAAQDKGSGIDRYEVQENRKQKIENRNWGIAESPYVLKDQELKSYIYVKAVDKAGNEIIEVVPARNKITWYENYLIWVIIALTALIACIIWKIYAKKKQAIINNLR